MSEELQHVEKLEDFENLLKSNKMLAVDFFAVWCGPCQFIGPVFAEQSKNFPEVKFIKVDVDKSEDISRKYEIECMPTFIFFKDGNIFERMSGANQNKLINSLYKLVGKEKPAPEGIINDLNTFEKIIKENKLVAVDCFAEWCGPCQFISPVFEEFKKNNPTIKFIKCDADEAREIYQKYKVNCMPTFITFKNGKEEDRFSGANPEKLKEIIEDLKSPDTAPITIKAHEHPLFEKQINGFICELCFNKFNDIQKCYKCKECRIFICEKCKKNCEENKPIEINKNAVKSKYHNHLLIKTQRPCRCDICRNSLSESLCCEKCDFDLCFECHSKE